jgi:hypothetical protein
MSNSIFKDPIIDELFSKNPSEAVLYLQIENEQLKKKISGEIRCPGCGVIYFARQIKGIISCEDCGCIYDQGECRWE